jgi:hypothetical protein
VTHDVLPHMDAAVSENVAPDAEPRDGAPAGGEPCEARRTAFLPGCAGPCGGPVRWYSEVGFLCHAHGVALSDAVGKTEVYAFREVRDGVWRTLPQGTRLPRLAMTHDGPRDQLVTDFLRRVGEP